MARFKEAQLSIAVNQSNQTANVLIKGQVLVDPNDVGSFIIECSVLGDDIAFDDKLFQYQPGGFVAGGFTSVVPFEFNSSEQLGILNEDIIGKDEIYANLVLRKNNEIGPIVSKIKTNVVQISA
ncbi:MAG TPA: hypothetical protein VID27_16525 [Blastocatellia bacterium]|jgi:hypothetical protein